MEEFNLALCLLPSYSLHKSFSQFTVLDEDTLSELVSFLEDLLIVDVGHGWDEALEEQQDVAHTQRPKLVHYSVPPGLPGQGRNPWFTGTVVVEKKRKRTSQ